MSSDRFAPAGTYVSSTPVTHAATPIPSSDHGLLAYGKRRDSILDGEAPLDSRNCDAGREPIGTLDGEGAGVVVGGGDTSGVEPSTDKASLRAGPRKKRKTKGLLSFGDADDDDEGLAEEDSSSVGSLTRKMTKTRPTAASPRPSETASPSSVQSTPPTDPQRITANSSISLVPKLQSKAALRREAVEREALRQEFLALQASVKATEIAIPFVFHDGSDLPGGTVRVRKGDPVWLFLDRGRKVGATRAAGGSKANQRARREWARVSVDDLMMVRGSIIIPPVGCEDARQGNRRVGKNANETVALRDLLLYSQQDCRSARAPAF